MTRFLMRLLGHKMAHKAIAKHTENGGVLDLRFGLALLRDRRIPIGSKLLSLAIGAGTMAVLMVMEMPLETLIALLLPVIGIVGDVVVDGLEAVAGPIIIAALLLPHIAPKPIVQQLRAERAGQVPTLGATA